MFGPVYIAGSKIRDQKLGSTENIQRQEAVVIVVPMEEPSLLLTMHGIISRIEVQNQLFGRFLEGGDELLHQQLGYPPGGATGCLRHW